MHNTNMITPTDILMKAFSFKNPKVGLFILGTKNMAIYFIKRELFDKILTDFY